MSRSIHVIGNWKMNHTTETADQFWDDLEGEDISGDVVAGLAVPSPLLLSATEKCPVNLRIYSQNVHHEKSGAYTGELSAAMVASCQCRGTLVGHSERREYFHEDAEQLRGKMSRALEEGLEVIFCCGETLETRRSNDHIKHVGRQVREGLQGLTQEHLTKVSIAYEPIWAIGTGETASAVQAEEMCAMIRSVVAELFGQSAAGDMIILYGGSVKPANCVELFEQPNVDGGLVGGASLKSESFLELLRLSSKL